MPGLLPNVDPNGLDEFSVVFTDRSLNHMSAKFQGVMRDISSALKEVYKAEGVALIPGGGSFAMEAVARQFTSGKHALILRNGWFSYRWSQIFEAGNFTSETSVIMARPSGNTPQSPYAPPPIEEVVSRIHDDKPDMVFAPHVETSAGLILPDDYIAQMAKAAHDVGALMVLDCIASGCIWVDMAQTGVDVLISAPQKGWSASPSAGMDATMPTDAIVGLAEAIEDTRSFGFEKAKAAQWQLGDAVRNMLAEKAVTSVAAPVQVGESSEFQTFRLGLFGLDKLADVDGTLERLRNVVEKVL